MQTTARVRSIDIVRGAVMVLMAIDHVRVFAGVPAGGPSPGVFFTRWVTHFCAPTFVFLAGTSAFLHGQRLGSRGTLARWLLLRGAWLILLELTVLRLAWTFNFDYRHYVLAGVIWVIGWCMVLLAGLVFLPVPVIGGLGVAILLLHNLINPGLAESLGESPLGWLWQVLYFGGPVPLAGGDDPPLLAVLYSLVPWIGVMAAGYAFGAVVRLEPARRRRIFLGLGGAAVVLFVVLRAADVYGDPRPWRQQSRPPAAAAHTAPATAAGTATTAPAPPPPNPPSNTARQRPRLPPAIAFINTTKYPASLLFLLMTLGPMLVALALLENARGRMADVLAVFGRVPFFFYLLHIPLIHLVFVGLSLVRFGEVIPWLRANHPVMPPEPPEGYPYSLPALYGITTLVVALLYFPCRWFAGVKQRRPGGLTSYL
jgi:uncharacterized membrane protein